MLYNNTGSSISGAAQKPLAQIENSVYNTFGDISKPVVTGKVSSNNLLAEYSATPKYVPVVYEKPNPTLLGTIIEGNTNRFVKNVTAPIDFNHIFNLEINRRGRVVGGHLTSGNIIEGRVIQTYPSGVYEAELFIKNPNNFNELLPKSNNNGISTMFPRNWTQDRVKVEVDFAYQNRINFYNYRGVLMWKGKTPSGIWVEGYTTPNTTVYPQKK